MKKSLLIILITTIVSILSVNAAPSLDFPEVDFGDQSTGVNASKTITITNDGDENLTGLVPRSTADTKYNVVFGEQSFDLLVGESKDFTLYMILPNDVSAGELNFGDLYFETTGFESNREGMKVTVTGGLIIDVLDITLRELDGDTDTIDNVNDGEKLDFDDDREIGPGSLLTFYIKVESLFLDSSDTEIDDVFATVTIKDIDDGDDIEEESESIILEPEDNENLQIDFDIPLQVNAGEYDLELVVEGEDENSITHTINWDLKLEVDKERHDVYIQTLSLATQKLSCNRMTTLNANVVNLGTAEEDEVKIEVKNADLELSWIDDDITLVEDAFDDENEYAATVPITVSKDQRAGTYPLTFNVYINRDILFANRKINLIIEDCETDLPEPEEEPEEEEPEEEEPVEEQEPVISNFEDCAEAGNTIRNMYPRECVTEEGQVFREINNNQDSPGTEIPILNPIAEPVEDDNSAETEEPSPLYTIIVGSLVLTIILVVAIVVIAVVLVRPKK